MGERSLKREAGKSIKETKEATASLPAQIHTRQERQAGETGVHGYVHGYSDIRVKHVVSTIVLTRARVNSGFFHRPGVDLGSYPTTTGDRYSRTTLKAKEALLERPDQPQCRQFLAHTHLGQLGSYWDDSFIQYKEK